MAAATRSGAPPAAEGTPEMRFAGQRERDRARQPRARQSPESRAPSYFALMITVFMNASPMLSDVASPRSATAMCTMRRS